MSRPIAEMTTEMSALKAKLKGTWTAGDFGQIAQSYAKGAAKFISRLSIKPGQRVLDVACGTGNLSFPAAYAGASVTGMDIAPNLLEQARARARAEGLQIQFDEGDAEMLQYADGSFDLVTTMFGAMFAPRPDMIAAELIRVCRPGGLIAMANWTPTGFVGQMFKLTASHVPPPSNMPSPVKWGDEETVRERLQKGTERLQLTRRPITFEFPFPVPEVIEFWRNWYGPTHRAFLALDEKGRAELRRDMERLWSDHNQATDGTTRVESEYLEVIATRS